MALEKEIITITGYCYVPGMTLLLNIGNIPLIPFGTRRRKIMDSFKDPAAYTPIEFRQVHKLGHSKYHELKKLGLGPRETIIGRKHLIFAEHAAEWRRKMTELSAPKVSEAAE